MTAGRPHRDKPKNEPQKSAVRWSVEGHQFSRGKYVEKKRQNGGDESHLQ